MHSTSTSSIHTTYSKIGVSVCNIKRKNPDFGKISICVDDKENRI